MRMLNLALNHQCLHTATREGGQLTGCLHSGAIDRTLINALTGMMNGQETRRIVIFSPFLKTKQKSPLPLGISVLGVGCQRGGEGGFREDGGCVYLRTCTMNERILCLQK